MSNFPYPESEHVSDHVDYFGTSLPDALVTAESRKREAEGRAEEADLRYFRYDEGVCCLQWLCSCRSFELYPETLSELAIFAATGREPDWLRRAREDMGFDVANRTRTRRRATRQRHQDRGTSYPPSPLAPVLLRLLGYASLFGGSAVFMGACLGALWLGPGMVLTGLVISLALFACGWMCFGGGA